MSMKQLDRVRAQLQDAFDGVQAELAKCQTGQTAVDSEAKLKWMASSLKAMLSALNKNKSERPPIPGLWHPVTDTWPFKHALGRKLVEAESAYEKLP